MSNDALNSAKKLVKEQVRNNALNRATGEFAGYQKAYLHTNENINFYMQYANVSKNSDILTVLGSGDHAFNLITEGARNIDSFDINGLAEYIALGLKKAMILKYNYYEYLVIYQKLMDYDIELEELSDIIMELTPLMDKEYRDFWRKLVDYNYKLQKHKRQRLNLVYLICAGVNSSRFNINNNKFLVDEAYYEILKCNLGQANLSYRNVNAINLAHEYVGKKYDSIFLSNTMDYFFNYFGVYWKLQLFFEYTNSLERLTHDNGVIFVNYIFDLFDGYTYNERAVRDSLVFIDAIKDYFDIIKVPIHASQEIIDGIILRRVNSHN